MKWVVFGGAGGLGLIASIILLCVGLKKTFIVVGKGVDAHTEDTNNLRKEKGLRIALIAVSAFTAISLALGTVGSVRGGFWKRKVETFPMTTAEEILNSRQRNLADEYFKMASMSFSEGDVDASIISLNVVFFEEIQHAGAYALLATLLNSDAESEVRSAFLKPFLTDRGDDFKSANNPILYTATLDGNTKIIGYDPSAIYYRDAIDAAGKAISLDPDNINAYIQRATASYQLVYNCSLNGELTLEVKNGTKVEYKAREYLENAVADYKRAISLLLETSNESVGTLYLNLGLVYEKLQQHENKAAADRAAAESH